MPQFEVCVHDPYRIDYLKKHIQAIGDAIELDGVDVMGYTPWGSSSGLQVLGYGGE